MKDQQEISKIGVLIRETRSARKMSRQQLADKCDIPKYRIAKAETDSGDVPVAILRTIIEKGLGGQFRIELEF